MEATGTVATWSDDEGWGVLTSEATPGGCFAHYAAILADGYRTLMPSDEVRFTFERAGQDGFDYRAVEVWPAIGPKPKPKPKPTEPGPPGPGYRSTLTITYDESPGDIASDAPSEPPT
jgi:CspA family cold shock protein